MSDVPTAYRISPDSGEHWSAPGAWTVRALSAVGNGDAMVTPSGAGIHEVDVKVA